MGRKRKIPEGYFPRWNSDSDDSMGDVSHYPSALVAVQLPSGNSTDTQPPDTVPIKKPRLHQEQEAFQTRSTDEEAPCNSSERAFISSEGNYSSSEPDEIEPFSPHEAVEFLPHDSLLRFPPYDATEFLSDAEFMTDDEQLPPDGATYHEEEEDSNDSGESEAEEDEREEDKDSFNYLFRRFSEDWTSSQVNHRVSLKASASFWNVARKWILPLSSAFNKDGKKKFPKFDHTRRKIVKKYVPPISMDVGFVHKETNELSVIRNSETVPIRKFPRDVYEKVFEIASIKVLIK